MVIYKLSMPDYNFPLHFTTDRESATKHFYINYDMALGFVDDEVLQYVSQWIDKVNSLETADKSYLNLFNALISKPENSQFYILKETFSMENLSDKIREFLSNVRRFVEKENIKNFFVIVSNGCEDKILEGFRSEIALPRENSLIGSQSHKRERPLMYAMMMK